MMARPEYKAKEGQEDRHGEMTGAIQVNMVLTAIPAITWSIFIGPWLLPDRLWIVITIGLAIAIFMPIAMLRVSQTIWAYPSDWMNHEERWLK